jgi:hypothetical protein
MRFLDSVIRSSKCDSNTLPQFSRQIFITEYYSLVDIYLPPALT